MTTIRRKVILIGTVLLLLTVIWPLQVYAQGDYAVNDVQLLPDNVREGKKQVKTVPLQFLLNKLHDQYQFNFVYNDRVIKDRRLPVTLLNKNEDELIAQLYKDLKLTGLQLSKLGKHQYGITLLKKKTLIPVNGHTMVVQRANQIHITGIVKDGVGNPLVGVTIRIKGSTGGTVTDRNGAFALDVQSADSLIISYIGYQKQTVAVGDNTNFTIILIPNKRSLNEVVVIGFGQEKRKDLTGSLATIDQKAISNMPAPTIDQRLVGQVAGVHIRQTSGAPGAGTSVKIRGIGSLGAGNEPLYVIDGIPYSSGMSQTFNPLSFLNPDDIASITILKDASSTAIYGSRGANGVIMITTKKGKAGQTRVNFSAMAGVQEVPQKGRPEMLGKRGFAELERDRIDILVRRINNREPVETDYPEEYRNPDQIVGQGTDWYNLILRKAMTQNYNLSVLKGTQNSNFNFSLGYSKQDGVIRYTGMKRFNARLGFNTDIGNAIRIGGDLMFTNVDQTRTNTNAGRNTPLGVSIWANPFSSPYDSLGNLKPYIQSPHSKYQSAWSFANPLFVLKNTPRKDKRTQNLGSVFVEWEIFPGLKAKSSLGVKQTSSSYSQYIPSTIGGNNKKPSPATGKSSNTRGKSFYWRFENTLTYNKTFGDHRINAVLGYVTQKSTSNYINLGAGPYQSDLVQTINAAQEINSWGQSINEWSMISYLGRINYSYKNRYLLTGTLRSDGSSRFGIENRYALFPSVAAAWRVSEEDFLKNSNVISNLKVRLSYGKSGNNNIGDYTHLAKVNTGRYVFDGNEVNASYVGLSNPYLTWEESSEFDVGINMEFLHNRLSLISDFYSRKSTNMLLDKEIPAITGYLSQLVNQGNVRNTGVEFTIGARPLIGNFKWDIHFNIAFNKNKVLSLNEKGARILTGNDDGTPTHITEVGNPVGLLFGYIFDGLYTEEDIANPDVAKHVTDYAGASKYKDVNGDGVISDVSDYTIIGNPHPDFTFGLSSNFSYKRVTLGIVLDGQYGGDVVNGMRQTVDNLQGFFNVSKEWVNRYRDAEHPGDGKHYGVPTIFPSYGHRISSRWIEDATFLRISNLTLGYSLPKNWMTSSNFIKNCNIYMAIQNLAVFTKYGGANPEANKNTGDDALTLGYDDASYPMARTISFGINLSF